MFYLGEVTPEIVEKFGRSVENYKGERILFCIFSPAGGDVQVSPVYVKSGGSDTAYNRTKAQNLQVSLNTFINRLRMDSPGSKISAVRFSSTEYTQEKGRENELLLQTWTDDPAVSTGLMNLSKGAAEAGMAKATDHDGDLYNYVMTGGTNAYTGLQAFKDYLANAEDIQGDEASRYIVLFTDGADDELTKDKKAVEDTEAVKLANELRDTYHYTIFTVQLISGDTASTDGQARPFLQAIAGGADNCFSAATVGQLENVFIQIFEHMPFKLNGYTVRDYIDPRFDLVANTKTPSAGGAEVGSREIVHLHADGWYAMGSGKPDQLRSNS